MMRTVGVVLLLLSLSLGVSAQKTGFVGNYEVVLVPVYFFGPGAYDSNWETRVTVVGVGERRATMPVPMLGRPFDRDCGPPDGEIDPFDVRAICSGYESPSGLLLYIPKTVAPNDVQINAHVRDLNRNAESAGTEIPVARDADFRATSFLLTHIPSDARFRANLRVYGGPETFSPDNRFIARGVPAGIEIYDAEDLSTPLVSTTLELSDPEYVFGSSHPVRPSYASIGDLTAAYPQLRDVAAYTIRVIPHQSIVDPPRDFTNWAFVTITNNETQEVTTVSP
jgi:hypothetical protein